MSPACVFTADVAVERLPHALAPVWRRLAGASVCVVGQQQPSALADATRRSFLASFPTMGLTVSEVSFADPYDLLLPNAVAALRTAAVAVKLVHGTDNRAGQVQAVLRSLGVRRTGHSVETDVLAQRKSLLKELMVANGVPTLPHAYAFAGEAVTERLKLMLEGDPDRLFVLKPDAGNASEGILVLPGGEVQAELAALAGPYVVEPYVAGRVLTIGVASVGTEVFVLPPVEYLREPGKLIIDQSDKRSPDRVAATGIDRTALAEAMRSAATLHQIVGASGLSRSDFIVTDDGRVVALEINTNIGLSRGNDIAIVFQESALAYEDLLWTHLGSAFNSRSNPEDAP